MISIIFEKHRGGNIREVWKAGDMEIYREERVKQQGKKSDIQAD